MVVPTAGLIDTGADQCVIPWEIAEALDLRSQSLTGGTFSSRGIGGTVKFKIAKLDLLLESQKAGPFELKDFPFAVPLTDNGPGYVLLGRHPLMSLLDIRFRMGFTDDPTFGKVSLTEVVKRRASANYVKGPAVPRV